MAWQRSLNRGPTVDDLRFSRVPYEWKTWMKMNGWSVVASGDGDLLYSSSGDVITGYWTSGDPTPEPGSFGNRYSWMVIEDPQSGWQFCFHHDPNAWGYSNWLIQVVAPTAQRFAGGSPTARATSPDEHNLLGDDSNLGGSAFMGASNEYVNFVANDEPLNDVYEWYVFAVDDTSFPGTIARFVAHTGVYEPSTSPADLAPAVGIQDDSIPWSELTSRGSGNRSAINRYGQPGEENRRPIGLRHLAELAQLPGDTDVGDHDSRYHSYLMSWWHTPDGLTPQWLGISRWAWHPATTVGHPNTINDLWVDQYGEVYALMKHASSPGTLIPGMDDTILLLPDLGGGLTINPFVLHGRPTVDPSTPPIVTVVSPAAGQILDRHGSVIFDVTDIEGLQNTIVWVEIVGAWEVVWGGDATGFAPAYNASIRSAIVNGYRYHVKRTGGWTASPRFHALAFDTDGNET